VSCGCRFVLFGFDTSDVVEEDIGIKEKETSEKRY